MHHIHALASLPRHAEQLSALALLLCISYWVLHIYMTSLDTSPRSCLHEQCLYAEELLQELSERETREQQAHGLPEGEVQQVSKKKKGNESGHASKKSRPALLVEDEEGLEWLGSRQARQNGSRQFRQAASQQDSQDELQGQSCH